LLTPSSELWRFFDLTADYLGEERWQHCRKSGNGAKKGKSNDLGVVFNDAVEIFYTHDSALGKEFRKNLGQYTPLSAEEDETLGPLHQRRKVNQERRRRVALEQEREILDEGRDSMPYSPSVAKSHESAMNTPEERSPYRERWGDAEWGDAEWTENRGGRERFPGESSPVVDPFAHIGGGGHAEQEAAVAIQARFRGNGTRRQAMGVEGEFDCTVDPFEHVGDDSDPSDVPIHSSDGSIRSSDGSIHPSDLSIEASELELLCEGELRQYLAEMQVAYADGSTKQELMTKLHCALQEEREEREERDRVACQVGTSSNMNSSNASNSSNGSWRSNSTDAESPIRTVDM
jgi:hypothetical protein